VKVEEVGEKGGGGGWCRGRLVKVEEVGEKGGGEGGVGGGWWR
jgi:hypothetical protein